MVVYRPFLIYSREEGVSPLGACSGRCNQSHTVEKRLRGFVLGLGHRLCSFGRGDDTEPKFVLTREGLLEVNERLNFANRDLFSLHKVRLLPLVKN